MKRLLFVLCAVLLISQPFGDARAQEPEQITMYGFSHIDTPSEMVGTVTTVAGFLEPPVGFFYPFSVDFVANEYTFYFQSTITSIVPGPMTTEIHYADAGFFIYEDLSKNGAYGTNPPNGTSPSTFQDGALVLSGTFSNIVRLNYFMDFPEPTIVAECTFTGGSKLGELAQGDNWTFHGGLSANVMTGIPAGYLHNWATNIVFSGPLPIEDSSWGKIKALYASN